MTRKVRHAADMTDCGDAGRGASSSSAPQSGASSAGFDDVPSHGGRGNERLRLVASGTEYDDVRAQDQVAPLHSEAHTPSGDPRPGALRSQGGDARWN